MDATGKKTIALELLRRSAAGVSDKLAAIDRRLNDYLADLATHPDEHNYWEYPTALSFIRRLRTYHFDTAIFRKVERAIEGEWEDGQYRSGGLEITSSRGRRHYRLTPLQAFIYANIYGFYYYVDLGPYDGRTALLESETVDPATGHVLDLRRLVTEAVTFLTRKNGKTDLASNFVLLDFMFGPTDGEALLCANSKAQSKIAFDMSRDKLRQLDPQGKHIRFTAETMNWKEGATRQNKIMALSAGAKTKDGLKASVVVADEYGSATYTNGRSDMASLVQVAVSSMGVRREPLTIYTTTAGLSIEGPFQTMLEAIKPILDRETSGGLQPPVRTHNGIPIGLVAASDYNFSLILQPDEEDLKDEERLLSDPKVWKKCNPHLGTIVQASFYEQAAAKARRDPEARKEFFTKLLNIFQTNKTRDWIPPERIKAVQTGARIDDLRSEDGWVAFCGLDFSQGDDIYAVSYLAVNIETGQFFADCDGWVAEEEARSSPNRALYHRWIADGWLHASPGRVFDTTLFLNRVDELSEHLDLISFGFDRYKARGPINDLKAWLSSRGADPRQCVVPVSQSYATYNPLVLEMNHLIKSDPPLLYFSGNPMWPWQFANCMLEESSDGMENLKVIKSSQNAKVDNVQALMNALYCFDLADGQVQ